MIGNKIFRAQFTSSKILSKQVILLMFSRYRQRIKKGILKPLMPSLVAIFL